MKDKKIDSLIKDAHKESQGIPFKEEYWDEMSNLLDANLPLNQTSNKVNHKKIIVLGLSIVLFVSSGLFLFFKNNPDLVSESIRQIDIKNSNTISTNEYTTKANKKTKSYSKITDLLNSKANIPTSPTAMNDDKEVNETIKIKNVNLPKKNAKVISLTPIEASIGLINSKFLFGLKVPNLSNVNFNRKNKLMYNRKQTEIVFNDSGISALNLFDSSNNNSNNKLSISAPANELISKPNKFIKHLAYTPFIGILSNTDKQQLVSDNSIYKIEPQNQLSFGANLQIETKRLALRIGLGFNKFDMMLINNVYKNNYDYDTSYTLVNPNYGITPSGKVIALIRKNIDSNYLSTTHSINSVNTTYQYINIPLTLQYYIRYKKLCIEIEAGINQQFMIPSNSNGLKLSYENKFNMPSFSYQFIFGSGINYAINNKYALGCRYNYAIAPTNEQIILPANKHQFFISLTRVLW